MVRCFVSGTSGGFPYPPSGPLRIRLDYRFVSASYPKNSRTKQGIIAELTVKSVENKGVTSRSDPNCF